MVIIDSWSGGASGFRQIGYRVVFDDGLGDYRLEYNNGGEWVEVKEGHRVAKGLAFMVIAEDLRLNSGKNVRRLA